MDRTLDSAPEGEVRPAVRRYLTVLFTDLTGSTALASALVAEHYRDLVNSVLKACIGIIKRHRGRSVSTKGDGLMAFFGEGEDHGRRAAEAALDLHAYVRNLRPPFPSARPISLTMHTGIHAGLVLLAEGDKLRGEHELIGAAANIAGHLSAMAGADEILVSAETLGPDHHLFVVADRRDLPIEGADHPLRVLKVVDRVRRASRYEARLAGGLNAFVGRQAESRQLDDALARVLDGHASFVALASSPGLGKTRLGHEFLARCRDHGCRVVRGYCESELSATPLQPFQHIVRDLFQIDHGQGPAEAAARIERGLADLGTAAAAGEALMSLLSIADPGQDTTRPHRPAPQAIAEGLRDVLSAVAARHPLVVFIDDWQWADDATHQALDTVSRIGDRPLLVLLATRGFGAADTALRRMFTTIELPPLSEAEATQSIRALLPLADPFLASDIRRYAGGNPLFIEELCHLAAEDVDPHRVGRLREGAAWLNVLIESRVGRLPEAQAELVRAASVVGNVVPAWLLERVTGVGADDPRVRQLAEEDLLFRGEQPGTLRFKHGITRDVIYESVGLQRRQGLHAQIAESLLQRGAAAAEAEECELLAYHFDAAGRPADAAHYAELAGNRAVLASALDRAQAQYRAALASLDRLEPSPERARRWNEIAQRLGLACVFDPSRSDLPLFERAVQLTRSTGDPALLARAQYWLGYILYALGDSREAVAQTEAARATARDASDNKLAVQIDATLGQALAAASRYDPALELLETAVRIKRSHRSGAGLAVGLAYSLASQGHVLADRGRFAASQACFEEALQTMRGAPHEVTASILGLRAAALLWQGRWAEAQEAALQACRIGEQVRSLFTLSMGRAAAAYAQWMLGQPDALQELIDATAWLLPRGNLLFRSLNHGWLADALVSAGRLPEARLHAAYALSRGRHDDLIGVAMACRAMARAWAGAGHLARARRWMARADAVARARGSAHERAANLLAGAQIDLGAGHPERAAAALNQALAAFRSLDMAWHESQALQACSRL